MKETVCFKNIGQLIQVDASSGRPRLEFTDHCALLVKNGRIEKVIPDSQLKSSSYSKVIDLKGRTIIPGLVDCHTHLIHAGERKEEMERRLDGTSYMDILKSGGGILNTVRATREADAQTLFNTARARMRRMMTLGTTAFEIKSGYGLDIDTEKKMLRVGQRLKKGLDVPVTLSYLGAHAVPEGSTQAKYFNFVMEHLPEFRDLADGGDIFCERGVFTVHDLKRLFLQAKLLGFSQLRVHAEELSHQGACAEAARLGAISCDHLEHAGPNDIRAMKRADTVAVLMPGVTLFLGGEKFPLIHSMIDAGVTLALATDCNPGSSPTYNMQTVLNLACHLYRITPEQALVAATYGSAKALNGHKEYGSLQPGQRADFLTLKTPDYRDLFYYFGENFVERTYVLGKPVRTFKDPATE
ncbi:MAG: imidazolonepropionase [Nitrospinae bacterium]|nr:imidazolonepropionase [Nitrospinota bacterium]